MSAEQVNYAKVVDALAIGIEELNRPCAVAPEPSAPLQAAVNSRAEAQRDAETVLRGLLGELERGAEGGADVADSTAAAAAEHGGVSSAGRGAGRGDGRGDGQRQQLGDRGAGRFGGRGGGRGMRGRG
jgi:hypothetical protein